MAATTVKLSGIHLYKAALTMKPGIQKYMSPVHTCRCVVCAVLWYLNRSMDTCPMDNGRGGGRGGKHIIAGLRGFECVPAGLVINVLVAGLLQVSGGAMWSTQNPKPAWGLNPEWAGKCINASTTYCAPMHPPANLHVK